ncbi:MAG: hypothetical protein K0R65_735 [Crocinitomicaceae bacterium]|nr:hypothetical protein [Crocinitomicaceae bacterium]
MWYADLGYSTAPFSIKFRDSTGNRRSLLYRNNSRPVLGFGFSYKWFSVRLGVTLPLYTRSVEKYGKTDYIDLGFEFKTKRHFYDVDLHSYRGYAIKNAWKWNDTLDPAVDPHLVYNNMQAFSLSVNTWRFLNPNIKVNVLRGRTGMYLKEEQSVYIRTTINYFFLSQSDGIIPDGLTFPGNSKLYTNNLAALDFGFIPGYVYVNRINNWQFSGMLGLGGVLQLKGYDGRAYLGLAPRYDFRLMFGYNVRKCFLNLVSEFDNKSIRFNDLRYRQTFYTLKLVGGFRFG